MTTVPKDSCQENTTTVNHATQSLGDERKGMKIQQIMIQKKINDEIASELSAEYINKTFYDKLITSNTDCYIKKYNRGNSDCVGGPSKQPLFFFRKGVVPHDMAKTAYNMSQYLSF